MIPRFGLTHEFAVLAMLLEICGSDDAAKIARKHPCIAHPLRKVVSYGNSPFITYAAAVNILFFYAKLQDAWMDDQNVRALLGKAFFALGNRRAGKMYQVFAQDVTRQIQALTALETASCASVDAIAEPFANLLATLFTVDGLMPASVSGDLHHIGYHLGKWIYLIDAAEDRVKDREKQRYNVYNIRYGAAPLPEKELLTRELCLATVAESWETLKGKLAATHACEIGYLDNLFYLGLRAKEDQVRNAQQEDEN